MRIIVAGGRDFPVTESNIGWTANKLKALGATSEVCGKARGADHIGELAAKRLGIPVEEFPADWNKFGKSAGHLRNAQMAEVADALIVFPGGFGTANMRKLAIEKGIPIYEYPYRA